MPAGATPGGTPLEERLIRVLDEARRLGFLGPGEPLVHLRHTEGLARIVEGVVGSEAGPAELCDLGAGGGVPGLILLCRWPEARGVLIEAGHRRCEALRDAAEALDLGDRALISEGRAEDLARDPGMREHFPVVVARSFGRPAVTAEIGAALVSVGGFLIVSDAPGGLLRERWPTGKLADLGLGAALRSKAGGATAAVILKSKRVDDRWPRRVGVPAKRPLW